MVDLKTIYEQITASFDKIEDKENDLYNIEIFQQPDTPIFAFAYWSKQHHILRSISFTNN